MVEHYEQKRFNKELESFYNAIPRNAEFLSGQYINANTGVRSNMFSDVIGIHKLDNLNAKVKYLLFLLKSINFRVLLTYFKNRNYTTWLSFNSTRYPHKLENFICSQSFFCSKYLIFITISINILPWGCESWALRISLLKQPEVFLHQIIQRIIGISMSELK